MEDGQQIPYPMPAHSVTDAFLSGNPRELLQLPYIQFSPSDETFSNPGPLESL